MNPQLADFAAHLNEAVQTTNDFELQGTKYRKREYVRDYAWCGLNVVYRAYIGFDLDFPKAAYRFEDVMMPVPTIITTNRSNGRCHYLYRLRTPVAYHSNSRRKPQDYYEAIRHEMGRFFPADRSWNNVMTKNPLSDRWLVQTYPTAYDLSDFCEYIDLPVNAAARCPPLSRGEGRNNALFETLRFWAYAAVRKCSSAEDLHESLEDRAALINATFYEPLPMKEVAHTVRCMARYVWKNKDRLPSRSRVLQFSTESATERMKAGAVYTNQKRCEKTLQMLQAAVKELAPVYGRELGTKALVRHTGLNVKTVRKYMAQVLPNDLESAQ